MHNNFYFLQQLSKSLEKILVGSVVSECFSQHKDELIIRFETHGEPFFIKATLDSSFSCLSFPEDFHRARKNSVDLFPALIGHRVTGIRQFQNERSFALRLSDDLLFLFKMHGNRSNVILFENESVSEVFKKNILADHKIEVSLLDRAIAWDYQNFVINENKLQSLYFTFGKIVWKYLADQQFELKTTTLKWTAIQDLVQQLNDPTFYLTEINGIPSLALISTGSIKKEFHEPVKAVNEFFYTYTHQFAFAKEQAATLSVLRSRLQAGENYYEKTLHKLEETERDNNYKIWADLIMANLHVIKIGEEKTTLLNFYTDQSTTIKLKKDLSPQKNAEVYYRKAKNQHLEIARLNQALESKAKEIETLKFQVAEIEKADNLKNLRNLVSAFGLNREEKEKAAGPLPYHAFEYHGFKIWVGRNAKSNDTLTLKYSYKEDLWLHAKDVAGSHVVIKFQSGKSFPKDVIERAAQLAAYHSKRKNETLCPVVITTKKYVRKRKGDPAGSVVVEREDLMLVEPKK